MMTDRMDEDLVRDAAGGRWEVETVTAPASWASALVHGDTSGLDDDPQDAAACRAWIAEAAAEGWRVVDVARDADGNAEEPWFSSSAGFHGSPYAGADLLDYVRQRPARC